MKRALIGIAATITLVIVAIALYLTLTDFSEYRTDIEEAVTEATGRELRINGEFRPVVFPPSLVAEGITYANSEWGADTPMVSVGHISVKVNLASVFSGPIVIEEFLLSDVDLLLEESADGDGNWTVGEDSADVDIQVKADDGVPVIVRHADIENIRITYRRPDTEDRVIELQSFNVRTTEERMLAAKGNGNLDGLSVTLAADIGPIDNFRSGRNLDLNLEADLSVLAITASGNSGNPETLEGTEVEALITSNDTAAVLELFGVEANVDGDLRIEAIVTAEENNPFISLDMQVGDVEAGGTITTDGNRIDFDLSSSSLRQLGDLADVKDLPEGPLAAKGAVIISGDSYELIDVTIETSAINLTTSANVTIGSDEISLNPFAVQVDESDVSGTLEIGFGEPVSISGKINSQLLDLSQFSPAEEVESGQTTEAVAKAPTNSKSYVFSEDPLPFDLLNAGSADLEVLIEKLIQGPLQLDQLKVNMNLEDGALVLASGFSVPDGGDASGKISLTSQGESATLDIQFDVSELRIGLGEGSDRSANEIPLIGLSADIQSSGDSMRTVAANSNGKILFTQGAGKVDNSALGFFAADIISELFSALNPFAKSEPYSLWECTVVALNIVDGKSTIEPMLAQSEKLTIVGSGTIDLNDEKLDISFNTKPRRGVGVSADMFLTPFIRLGGTMSAPRIALDKSGVLISGGAAVLTGGISFFVKGAADRASGASDRCAAALAIANGAEIETEE